MEYEILMSFANKNTGMKMSETSFKAKVMFTHID